MKKISVWILFICLIFLRQTAAFAFVNSVELIEKAKEYDRQKVIYQGEAVGDIMKRGDHAWVNVFDGSNAIGIWVSQKQLLPVKISGSYRAKGDVVLVKGIFHRSCPEHGGDLDIHAESIQVVKKGYEILRPIKKERIFLAVVLLFAAGGLLVFQKGRTKNKC